MKEKTLKIIIALLAVLLLAGVTAYAATSYGSKDDPLITKSYLDEIVKPQLENEMQEKMQEKLDDAAAKMLRSTPGEFVQVELKSGQTLRCTAGCQLLPVSGSLSAIGLLADTTAGKSVDAGDTLNANHLYLTTEEGGVSVGEDATVLVAGVYRID